MIIEFSTDLEQQKIYANGSELATVMGHDRDAKGNKVKTYPETKTEHVVTIDNPVLVTDVYRLTTEFSPTIRDTVS